MTVQGSTLTLALLQVKENFTRPTEQVAQLKRQKQNKNDQGITKTLA